LVSILVQTKSVLDFLSTPIQIDENTDLETARAMVLGSHLTPVPSFFDRPFHLACASAYNRVYVIPSVINSIGASIKTAKGFNQSQALLSEYRHTVVPSLLHWAEYHMTKLQKEPVRDEALIAAYKGFPHRLLWVLDQGLLNDPRFGLCVATICHPIPCEGFLVDIATLLNNHDAALTHIWQWLDGFAGHKPACQDILGLSKLLASSIERLGLKTGQSSTQVLHIVRLILSPATATLTVAFS